MVDLDWKIKMVEPKMNTGSASLAGKSDRNSLSPVIFPFADELVQVCSPSESTAYEQYLHLPELSKLWESKQWPNWNNESLLKPALQALEITFRFISLVLSDSRPYINKAEWKRRLESLTNHEIELIATFCEEEEPLAAPIVDLCVSNGALLKEGSSQEVWKLPGATPLVSRTSEQSLLPRLGTWKKSEDTASKIWFSIECHLQKSPFTLGLGEPNFAGKPNLEYDLVCKPGELHSLKKSPFDQQLNNPENKTLYTVQQILEAWLFTARALLRRICKRIDEHNWEKAAKDCWMLERIWKLLADIENLQLLVDPDDFLRLKNQLSIKASPESGAFCLRSKALLAVTRSSKDLKHKVPAILGVQVDPKGGPRIQEAVMRLFHSHGSSGCRDQEQGAVGRIHLLQAFQAIEGAVKRFFFSYQQLVIIAMGSLEAKGNQSCVAVGSDPLSQIFMEPPYFPSLDAAKTFLGDFWRYEPGFLNSYSSETRAWMKQCQ